MSATAFFSTPKSRRPTAFATCAVLAVVLNAAALGLVANAPSGSGGGLVARSEALPHGTMTLVSGREAPTPTVDAFATRIGSELSKRRSAKVAEPIVTSTTTASSTDTRPQPIVFYTFHEVDNPAFPESDWNLDADALDAIGVERLAFEVLINDRGEVVGCTVLSPADLKDDVKRSLERRLSETRLLPAERQGRFVPSVRRIELALAPAPLGVVLAPAAHRP